MRKAAAAVLVIVLLAAAGFFGLWTAGKKEADADTEPEKTVKHYGQEHKRQTEKRAADNK